MSSSSATYAADPIAARNQAVWAVGDFDRIAAAYREGAASFADRLALQPEETVLDVACGTGNLALPAARRGVRVTGLDIAPNLLATARARAAAERLDIRFEEGNAEALPYPESSFDTVVTMYGAMFAPRPDRVAVELLRVVRPGGRVIMANWTPASFVGTMLRAHVAKVPPAPGIPSPLLWGDEVAVRQRLGSASRLTTSLRSITFTFPVPPREVARLFRDWYGPTIRTFEALDEEGKTSLFDELASLWTRHNLASDGTTRVESEYLEVVAVR